MFWPNANLAAEFSLPLLYISNYAKAFGGSPDLMQHSWSLSVEMQFYLCWPIVLLLARRFSNRSLAILIFGLFIAATVWRGLSIHFIGDWASTYYRADTRLSGLFLGSLLAIWQPSPNLSSSRTSIYALVLILCAAFLLRWEAPVSLSIGTLLVEFCTFLLIAGLLNPSNVLHRLLGWGPLVLVGAWSYSLYLWHYPVIRALRSLPLSGTEMFVAALSISLPLAILTYYLVERPILNRSHGFRRSLAPAT